MTIYIEEAIVFSILAVCVALILLYPEKAVYFITHFARLA